MKDPVCGMEVDAKHDSLDYNGKKFYFCCASCKWALREIQNNLRNHEG